MSPTHLFCLLFFIIFADGVAARRKIAPGRNVGPLHTIELGRRQVCGFCAQRQLRIRQQRRAVLPVDQRRQVRWLHYENSSAATGDAKDQVSASLTTRLILIQTDARSAVSCVRGRSICFPVVHPLRQNELRRARFAGPEAAIQYAQGNRPFWPRPLGLWRKWITPEGKGIGWRTWCGSKLDHLISPLVLL